MAAPRSPRPSGERRIFVHADWAGLRVQEHSAPPLMGVLHATRARGQERFAFEYDTDWLATRRTRALDPRLGLVRGRQYAADQSGNFGAFLDSAPDRWGRLLMRRRESRDAARDERSVRALLESDYLLGVFDPYRMGALRFRLEPDGAFLAADPAFSVPPWTSLRELEHAAREIDAAESTDTRAAPTPIRSTRARDRQLDEWLALLLAPGASLGGARPKAGVLDENLRLCIAKFPSARDEDDIGAWEFVVHELAANSGIRVASARLLRLGSSHHTFVVERFDRTDAGERLHFASAMTLLARNDGDDAASGASYVELAEFIMTSGSSAAADLEELWRRIVFNMCVSNVDDHLRNHGFTLAEQGWRLAPAYDMNPIATGNGLRLNVSEDDNAQDLELARAVAPIYRVRPARAKAIIDGVLHAVRGWPQAASRASIPKAAQDRMASAFRLAA